MAYILDTTKLSIQLGKMIIFSGAGWDYAGPSGVADRDLRPRKEHGDCHAGANILHCSRVVIIDSNQLMTIISRGQSAMGPRFGFRGLRWSGDLVICQSVQNHKRVVFFLVRLSKSNQLPNDTCALQIHFTSIKVVWKHFKVIVIDSEYADG
jgi:hypothetical protein